MTQQELKSKLKSESLGGAYILCGEEDYLKKHYLGRIREAVLTDEAFAFFNHVHFEGAEVDIPAIEEAIKSPPMMSDYKLIEWKYPDFEKMKERDVRALCELAEQMGDYPYAILVFFPSQEGLDAGTVKRPSKLCNTLSGSFNLVNFEKSQDSQLIPWLRKHFEVQGIKATNEVLAALIFRAGHGMDVLHGEVEKLSVYLSANGIDTLTEELVKTVASSTLECDAFALSGAITNKSKSEAYLALLDMNRRRVAPSAIVATLARSFAELLTVSILLEEGKGASDIENLLKWKSYKTKLAINSARKWGKDKLSDALLYLRQLDGQSKSGGAVGIAPIEIFVARFL